MQAATGTGRETARPEGPWPWRTAGGWWCLHDAALLSGGVVCGGGQWHRRHGGEGHWICRSVLHSFSFAFDFYLPYFCFIFFLIDVFYLHFFFICPYLCPRCTKQSDSVHQIFFACVSQREFGYPPYPPPFLRAKCVSQQTIVCTEHLCVPHAYPNPCPPVLGRRAAKTIEVLLQTLVLRVHRVRIRVYPQKACPGRAPPHPHPHIFSLSFSPILVTLLRGEGALEGKRPQRGSVRSG